MNYVEMRMLYYNAYLAAKSTGNRAETHKARLDFFCLEKYDMAFFGLTEAAKARIADTFEYRHYELSEALADFKREFKACLPPGLIKFCERPVVVYTALALLAAFLVAFTVFTCIQIWRM